MAGAVVSAGVDIDSTGFVIGVAADCSTLGVSTDMIDNVTVNVIVKRCLKYSNGFE